MDEDSKIIEELRENNELQRAQILHLEKALKQAVASQEEVKMSNNNEIQKSKELIDDVNRKLANCMRTIDAKNIELLNLQTALGRYYAEIEAKVNKRSPCYVCFVEYIACSWVNISSHMVGFLCWYNLCFIYLLLYIYYVFVDRNIWKKIWLGQEKNWPDSLSS